jgi:MoxR-like ATPase
MIFVGSFVGSYVKALSDAALAAACGRVHALLVGPPGWGKSSLLRSFAARVAGPALFLSCDPTTPASKAIGRPHAGALLEGRDVLRTEGSLSDPEIRSAVVDEIFRASDPLWDALLPVLERDRPVVLATANWVAKGDRLAALKDRIALWAWASPSLAPADAAAVAAASLARLALDGSSEAALGACWSLPDWPEPQALAEVWRMRPGPKAAKAVSEAVRALAEEALREGFAPNPRRVDHWARVLYGRTCLEVGAAEWDSAAEPALRALAFAWPAESEEDAAAWRRVALRVVDRAGALIDAVLAEIRERLRAVAAAKPEDRAARIMETSRFLAERDNALKAVADPRAAAVRKSLDRWFRLAVQGVDPWSAPEGSDDNDEG